MTKPLRELTQQDTEWCWDDTQNTALNQLKEAVTRTPTVAYASTALTSAETRYAQIEKELLAINFTCERFDTYIYGRDVVMVEALGGHCAQGP